MIPDSTSTKPKESAKEKTLTKEAPRDFAKLPKKAMTPQVDADTSNDDAKREDVEEEEEEKGEDSVITGHNNPAKSMTDDHPERSAHCGTQ